MSTTNEKTENKPSPRAHYLAEAKARALACIERGDIHEAFISMSSDLSKSELTAGHVGIELGTMQLMAGHLTTAEEMRIFIEGFN